jgi:hypothetical protein
MKAMDDSRDEFVDIWDEIINYIQIKGLLSIIVRYNAKIHEQALNAFAINSRT